MQNIATENNLSETAFVMKRENHYGLRWFTPKNEIDLCGHATLASSFVIANFVDSNVSEIHFETKSGKLSVEKQGDLYVLNFPSNRIIPTNVSPEMKQAIGTDILEAYISVDSRDLVLLLENQGQIENLSPNFDFIKPLASHAVCVTAKVDDVDFVSRFFAPNFGVLEDPVTGSAHTRLIPFWADKLCKKKMVAVQLSKRGGLIFCENCGDRVIMAGKAALYLKGDIFV